MTSKIQRIPQKRVGTTEVRRIVKGYRSGVSVSRIARQTRRSIWTVSRVLSKAGVRKRRQRVQLDPEAVHRLYESGKTLTQVAEALGTTASVVYSTMRRWQIPRRGRGRPIGRVTSPERDRAMVGLRQVGATLQEIGDLFAITRERVRQILVGTDFRGNLADLRKNRRKRLLQGIPFPTGQALKYLTTEEGVTLAEIARRLGCDVSTARAWFVQMGIPLPPSRREKGKRRRVRI